MGGGVDPLLGGSLVHGKAWGDVDPRVEARVLLDCPHQRVWAWDGGEAARER